MKLKYGVGLILASLLSGAVYADMPSAAAGEFYVDPGIAMMGAGASNYGNSFSLDAGYLKAIHAIASIGWEAGYVFGAKDNNFTSSTNMKIIHLAPEIKLGPTIDVGGYKVNPFVIGGGGLYWSQQGSGTLPNGTTVSSFNNVNGGWNIGLGAQVILPGNWSVGVDFRRQDIVYKNTTDFTWFTPALRFALIFS